MSQMTGFATAITNERKDVKIRWLLLHSWPWELRQLSMKGLCRGSRVWWGLWNPCSAGLTDLIQTPRLTNKGYWAQGP